MQHTERVTAVIEREGDGYVALCPELDIASQGDSIEEARANLEEALGLFFEAARPHEIADRFHQDVYVTHLDIVIERVARQVEKVPGPRSSPECCSEPCDGVVYSIR